MKKGDTRGLSTVITTLLVILLVIVAVAIVWGVIKSLIQKNSEQISLGQFTIDLEIVSIKQTNEDVSIKVKRNPGEGEIEGLTFSIFDGEETHIYERHNISLDQLETKTFKVDYQGKIVSISVYPNFVTSSGKTTIGSISDTYYAKDSEGQSPPVSSNCTPNCVGKECGDDGCFGKSCGNCSGSQKCILGQCVTTTEPCEENCSCAATTCTRMSCSDGCEGSCSGTLQPVCTDDLGNTLMCGSAQNEECLSIPNACGECVDGSCDQGICCEEGEHNDGGICCEEWEHNDGGICCEVGEHNYEGTCQHDCLSQDCGIRECGPLPGASYCGENFCGVCNVTAGETCNESLGACIMCSPDCAGRDCGIDPVCGTTCGTCNETAKCNVSIGSCTQCQDDCGSRNCGPVPNGCGENCGLCNEEIKEYCSVSGICVIDRSVNNGTVFSVWPWPSGRLYFDSPDLPKNGTSYQGYFVKLESEYDCLRIWEYINPQVPAVYNMTYMKVSLTATDIEPGDKYEIWKNQTSCMNS